MLVDKYFKHHKVPSPLILEGEDHARHFEELVLWNLCETQAACGACPGCKKVKKNFHPDWIHMDGSVKMEEFREKLSALRQKPFEAKVRVFTMAHFEDASTFVQNALLKTLEEPLAHWIILMGVRSRFRLLETIRSRCLILKLPPVSQEAEAEEWSDKERKFYTAIQTQNHLDAYQFVESEWKERDHFYRLLLKFLKRASEEGYPGHWLQLAPLLERGLAELERNINPKIVWDRAWATSLDDKYELEYRL